MSIFLHPIRGLCLSLFLAAAPASAQMVWTTQTSGMNDIFNDVAFGIDALSGNRQFVAVGTNTATPTIATSPDGVTWTRRTAMGTGPILNAICHDGAQWVAVGTTNNATTAATSPDGITWTNHPTGIGGEFHDVICVAGELIAVGGNGAQAVVGRSSDGGVTWTQELPGIATTLHAVAAGGNKVIAVGTQGVILTAPWGGSLTGHQDSGANGNHLYALAYKRDVPTELLWFAGGTNGAVLRSDDNAAHFNTVPAVTADHLHDFAWSGPLTVAVGTDGRVLCSDDRGVTWNQQTSITANTLHGVTFGVLPNGIGRFVAVGTNGAVHTTDLEPVSGGTGLLVIDPPSSRTFSHFGTPNKTMTLEAEDGPVTVSLYSSQSWMSVTPTQIELDENQTVQVTISCARNFDESPRAADLTIHHNGSDVVNFFQNGGPPPPVFLHPIPDTTFDSITIAWSDPSRPVGGFRVERLISIDPMSGDEIWQVEGIVGPDDRSFTVTGLAPWTEYRLRVFAFNANGDSVPTEQTVRTRPDYPRDLTATPRGWSQMDVTWFDVAGGDRYWLERRIGIGGPWRPLGYFPGGVGYFGDGGLPADTEIAYRIATHPDTGTALDQSATSPEVTARTGQYDGQIFWGDAEEVPIGPPPQETLVSLVHGNGKYVAVGYNAEIVGSPDGTTWTREASGSPAVLGSSAAYGNGTFVATGLFGTLLTSSGDGNWTAQAADPTHHFTRVIFADGRFLTTAITGVQQAALFESTDGMTWTTLIPSFFNYALNHDNGLYVRCFETGHIETSPDAVNWTRRRTATAISQLRASFAWNGSTWVGVGQNGGITTSPDAVTWTDGQIATNDSLSSVTAGGGRFVAVGSRGQFGSIMTSTDGTTWAQAHALPSGVQLTSVVHVAGEGFTAVGAGGIVLRSADGLSWTEVRAFVPTGGGGRMTAIECGDGTVVAVGQNSSVWRRDPVTRVWEEQTVPQPAGTLERISYAGGNFYLARNGAPFRSADGIIWAEVPELPDHAYVSEGPGRLVALAGVNSLSSDNGGASWDPVPFASIYPGEAVFAGGVWTGNSGAQTILISHNGLDWDHAASVFDVGPGMSYGGTIAGRVNGAHTFVTRLTGGMQVSRDGDHWVGNSHDAYTIAYGDGVFVTVGPVNEIHASVDGVNWEPAPAGFLPPILGYRGLCYVGDGEFCAVGGKRVVHRFHVSAFPITRSDPDGVPDATEDAAPNNGDGNNDGTPDSQQPHVASFPVFGGNYLTLAAPAGSSLANVGVVANPSPSSVPVEAQFPLGFLSFELTGLAPGAATTIEIHFPPSIPINSYYKYGPTPDDPISHWYLFDFDPVTGTGAVITPGLITLHFVDGERGDDDLTANGIITDDGAAAIGVLYLPAPDVGPGTNGSVEITVTTTAGRHYRFEASDDLILFDIIATVTATATETVFIDTDAPNYDRRFYRVAEVPAGP